jgi:hypothetical protein
MAFNSPFIYRGECGGRIGAVKDAQRRVRRPAMGQHGGALDA